MITSPYDPITSGVLKISQGEIIFKGLNKREYFAAMAMLGNIEKYSGVISETEIAKYCVQQADALINELNK